MKEKTSGKKVVAPVIPEDPQVAIDKQKAIMDALGDAYSMKLEEEMGQLHNQFVAFISASRLPLPQALLVIEMIRKELIDQAYKKFLGDK
jgi:hypothetical protein